MPTKRKKRLARPVGISARALEAWRIGDYHALNREFALMPCDLGPFDVDRATPPDWLRERDNTDAMTDSSSWRHAWQLRRRLIGLGGPPGRVGRHGQPLGPARKRS